MRRYSLLDSTFFGRTYRRSTWQGILGKDTIQTLWRFRRPVQRNLRFTSRIYANIYYVFAQLRIFDTSLFIGFRKFRLLLF